MGKEQGKEEGTIPYRNNSDSDRPKTLPELRSCNSLVAYVINVKSHLSRYKHSLLQGYMETLRNKL